MGDGITSETVTKLMHDEIGIYSEEMVKIKICVFNNKKLRDTSDIQTYKKAMRKSHIIDSKRMSLMGLFLWDMRSRPKCDDSDIE